ncbi:MAG: hypothetical protein KDH15_09640 [Rhodocyclaceae bacterium]|nr:hypothetical protein [Rhodocyclaceae bacterium]
MFTLRLRYGERQIQGDATISRDGRHEGDHDTPSRRALGAARCRACFMKPLRRQSPAANRREDAKMQYLDVPGIIMDRIELPRP